MAFAPIFRWVFRWNGLLALLRRHALEQLPVVQQIKGAISIFVVSVKCSPALLLA